MCERENWREIRESAENSIYLRTGPEASRNFGVIESFVLLKLLIVFETYTLYFVWFCILFIKKISDFLLFEI